MHAILVHIVSILFLSTFVLSLTIKKERTNKKKWTLDDKTQPKCTESLMDWCSKEEFDDGTNFNSVNVFTSNKRNVAFDCQKTYYGWYCSVEDTRDYFACKPDGTISYKGKPLSKDTLVDSRLCDFQKVVVKLEDDFTKEMKKLDKNMKKMNTDLDNKMKKFNTNLDGELKKMTQNLDKSLKQMNEEMDRNMKNLKAKLAKSFGKEFPFN